MKQGDFYFRETTMQDSSIIQYFLKVVIVDDYEILFEGRRVNEIDWELDNKRIKRFTFSRMSRFFFEKIEKPVPVFVGHQPYDLRQLELVRPDLPIRIGRFRDVSWRDSVFNTEDAISMFIKEHAETEHKGMILNSNKVYLIGIRSSTFPATKEILFEAKNGQFFPMAELLYCANQVMLTIKSDTEHKSKGIGLYRFASRGGIPVYYIWGFYDLADILEGYETRGVDITNA